MSNCLFYFSFIGHDLAYSKTCHNWVHVLNFLVTFLLTNTAFCIDATDKLHSAAAAAATTDFFCPLKQQSENYRNNH